MGATDVLAGTSGASGARSREVLAAQVEQSEARLMRFETLGGKGMWQGEPVNLLRGEMGA